MIFVLLGHQDGGTTRAAFQRVASVFEVRSAIHVRTGQRGAVEAIDAWLSRHQVAVVPLGDAYQACVYLLKHYQRIPDLALIGADWLADDELNIVPYLRHTWPRTGVLVYGSSPQTPLCELLPLMRTCRGEAALRELLARTPAELLRDLCTELAATGAPVTVPTPAVPTVPGQVRQLPQSRPVGPEPQLPRCQCGLPEHRSSPADEPGLRPGQSEAPRSILTAEELSALLGTPEKD